MGFHEVVVSTRYVPLSMRTYLVETTTSFVKGKMFVGHWIKYVIYQLKWFKLFMVKLCRLGLEEEKLKNMTDSYLWFKLF